jgi:hypothetical protein
MTNWNAHTMLQPREMQEVTYDTIHHKMDMMDCKK